MLIMELSMQPLSAAEPAFHSGAANYLSGSPQTDRLLSVSQLRICHQLLASSMQANCIGVPAEGGLAEGVHFMAKVLVEMSHWERKSKGS